MDAVKFLKEAERMCDYYAENDCVRCPNRAEQDDCSHGIISIEDAAINVERVEKWSSEHQLKTRLDVFKEMFPNANSECTFCPQTIEGKNCYDYIKFDEKANAYYCVECRKLYWNSPAPDGFGKGK